MTDTKQNLLQQVQNELRSQELKQIKASLKTLVEEHTKAEKVRAGVEAKIVALLEESGMTQQEITEALKQD